MIHPNEQPYVGFCGNPPKFNCKFRCEGCQSVIVLPRPCDGLTDPDTGVAYLRCGKCPDQKYFTWMNYEDFRKSKERGKTYKEGKH